MSRSSDSTSIQTLAESLTKALQTKKRNDGNEFVSLKDGSPQWMTDVIHEAHGDKLPDDTTYAFIEKAADAIADSEDPQDAISELEPDPYTNNLTGWLHARADHVYYLTEILEEGSGITDGFQLLAAAQQKQIHEVGYALISALENAAEQMEDAEPEESEASETEEN
jgi:hypothetical protein